jgi:hypothetical protein
MPSKNVNGVSADAQPRSRNQSLIDCVADCGISRARAFGPHVTLGGEACHEVRPSS